MDLGRRPGVPLSHRERRRARLREVGSGSDGRCASTGARFTFGILANHIWSFAGDDDRPDISSTFLQPFLNFTTKTYTTFGVNTESTYDWENKQWTVPINLTIAQLVKLGKLPVQFTLGGRYYAERPSGGPDWGLRFVITFLFPK
jgi:hypothetical protein